MELIRGFKPFSSTEIAFASEKAKLARAEVQAVCEMNDGLLNYPLAKSGADFLQPKDAETDGASIKSRRYMRRYNLEHSLEKRRKRLAYSQKARP